ncbi:hypothetical protein E2C01_097543 [Portunus trituberculatus]|uniref:Uncharacterized protein n=1 Tax=Portunus trituberculatus TaxID=210409 RepID=A0A5B7KA76_PORTR|nr:hypothetical protein [Portunus trituberculatus]
MVRWLITTQRPYRSPPNSDPNDRTLLQLSDLQHLTAAVGVEWRQGINTMRLLSKYCSAPFMWLGAARGRYCGRVLGKVGGNEV